ncbi:MAG: glutathione S-transferase family protein [Gammaproteobacteria bacterium]|nr:glutathione S-transferase family protein [Gammaproteobacteria bacterium]MBK9666480.1 glutathione S-transferase family protein [Gammaproteobacteria bacterium]
MKLYGICLSPYVRKVAVVINVKGLECEREDAFPGSLSRAISPLGKIPALQDGALTLADSSVICEYLEEQYPAVAMLPKSPADRARSRWLEEFGDTRLGELCGGGIFFERVVKQIMHGEGPDEEKVSNTIDNLLPPMLDYLESELPPDGFAFGMPGIADISIATHFVNAEYAGYTVDASRWPRIAALLQRVRALPGVQRQLQEEAALMAQMGAAK